MRLSEELVWRGFVNQTTLSSPKELDKKPIKFYWGVDPSASSMTIGNLATAMMAKHFISHGHKAILLVGGATGLIGDPDGKTQERELKTKQEITANKKAITGQYRRIFSGQNFTIVDNYEWFKNFGYLDFLREVGKHVPMRQMLAREFLQTRLGEDSAGISYAEFSYALIQGYDFLHLFENHGVTLQVCGSDQWGNSIAGVDLIRRKTGKESHVWSAPLVLDTVTGKKFGKTEEGAIWLDDKLTSVFKFYQFWLNVSDDSVEQYLKIYTTMDKPTLEKIIKELKADPSKRLAQKTLAYEVTKTVHGHERAESVVRASGVLFGADKFETLNKNDINMLKTELTTVKRGQNIAETLVKARLARSNSEAMRFAADGAVEVNGHKITPAAKNPFKPGPNLVKRGKNSFAIVE